MSDLTQQLRIQKKKKAVILRTNTHLHIDTNVFLLSSANEYGVCETPFDILNSEEDFFATEASDSTGSVFFNKNNVIQVDYQSDPSDTLVSVNMQKKVEMELEGGELLVGKIEALLPPDHSRLYDAINVINERFVKITIKPGVVTLINKLFITWIKPVKEEA